MNWQAIFQIAFGVFNVSMALVVQPKRNWMSYLLFKLVPFFGGLLLLLIGLGVL